MSAPGELYEVTLLEVCAHHGMRMMLHDSHAVLCWHARQHYPCRPGGEHLSQAGSGREGRQKSCRCQLGDAAAA